MSRLATTLGVIIMPIILAIGLVTGLFLRPVVDELLFASADAVEEDDHHEDDHADEDEHHDDEEHEEHIALTQQAYQNLKLTVSEAKLSDYTQMLRMPGKVTEAPGVSVQKSVASVSGYVSRLFVSPGVTVLAGDPICELQITDDRLMDAQLRFLELLTKEEIADAELNRLDPLVSAGSVAGRKRLEWEYQKKELESSLNRARQELAMRGLAEEQIDNIASSQVSISKITIRAPETSSTRVGKAPRSFAIDQVSSLTIATPDKMDLTVEELLVETGQNVARGEPICSLAEHRLLYICGHAFENEIGLVSQLAGQDVPVAIEFGDRHTGNLRQGLKVQYVAGHVDQRTQTYRFFVPLTNEVVQETTDSLGNRFQSWRYKVGQRVHVLVPTEIVAGQFVLPRDAVVQEGPNAFVFREHIDEMDEQEDLVAAEEEHDEHDHDHEEVYIEFEPVPVTVVDRNKSVVVVVPGEELAIGDRIALGSAYQLLLALKAQSEGGGGHHHHHH